MSAGTGDTLTLFDANGNPVTVQLINGRYQLAIADESTRELLAEILGELRDIKDILANQ